MPRRSQLEQKIDILKCIAIRERVRPTRLMGFANMSAISIEPMIVILERHRYIEIERLSSSRWITITASGLSIIKDFDSLVKRLA